MFLVWRLSQASDGSLRPRVTRAGSVPGISPPPDRRSATSRSISERTRQRERRVPPRSIGSTSSHSAAPSSPPASTAPGMFAQVAPWRRFRRPGTTGSITGLRENESGSFVCFVGPSSLAVPASLVAACFPVSFAALLSFCAGGGLAFERPGRKRSPPGSPPPVARARPSRTSRSTQFIAGPARRAPRSPRLFPEFGRRNNRC